ncbi:hypothetical protein ACFLS1_00060 [Verrucomicrobiota bacterium]
MTKDFFKILLQANLTLPALEISILLMILALCLVCRYNRVGLIAAYLFAYKWGWTLFIGQNQSFLLAYLLFGCIVGILTAIGLLRSSSAEN